jgi:hypothetical protein
MASYTGRRFRIYSNNGSKGTYTMAEGVIGEQLGAALRDTSRWSADVFEHYRATVTVMFNPNNIHDVGALVYIRDLGELDEFHMKTDVSQVFGDYTSQLEWI